MSKIANIEDVPLNCIRPSRFQVRETFKQEDLEALARSFQEGALSQPILLRRVAANTEDAKDASGQPPLSAYEVISGSSASGRRSSWVGRQSGPSLRR